jgi:polyhydroxyalkanoate synthesis regulator protein
VTLEEISQIIREGNEIQVIDNKTKNDITFMTQLQLLADQERKTLTPNETNLLKRVIRSEKGTFTGYVKELEAKLGLTFEDDIVTTNTMETPVMADPMTTNFMNSNNNMMNSIETSTTLN